jgi:hypothetical protein
MMESVEAISMLSALNKLLNESRQNAGPVASRNHFVVDDLTHFEASQTQYEVVMAFYYLERKIFSEIVKSLLPGGLLRLASGLKVLHYREVVAEKATAELVARKGNLISSTLQPDVATAAASL